MDDLHVYTWTGVLNDYTAGCISVIARSLDEARQAAVAAIVGPSWDNEEDGDIYTINNFAPKVSDLTIPHVFCAPGSA